MYIVEISKICLTINAIKLNSIYLNKIYVLPRKHWFRKARLINTTHATSYMYNRTSTYWFRFTVTRSGYSICACFTGASFAFSIYDFDGSGKIDAFNLGDVLRALNSNPTQATVEKLGGTKKKGEKTLTVSFDRFLRSSRHIATKPAI